MIYGVGIDIVETDRIARILARGGERFLERCYTEDEIRYCQSHGAPNQSFAARFAAKEAVSKAFGTGIGEKMNFIDIEVVRETSGKPSVKLHRAAAAFAAELGVAEVKVSLSHTANYAAAYAVVILAT
jgi:holo-[acyl-carrier protein] synthase